jgi:hypothetical protein
LVEIQDGKKENQERILTLSSSEKAAHGRASRPKQSGRKDVDSSLAISLFSLCVAVASALIAYLAVSEQRRLGDRQGISSPLSVHSRPTRRASKGIGGASFPTQRHFPRGRVGIDQANNYYCHTLTSRDRLGPGPLGAGTLVSATARNHGGASPRSSCGFHTEVPPRPDRARRSPTRSRAGTS